jgi:hypothetical protein
MTKRRGKRRQASRSRPKNYLSEKYVEHIFHIELAVHQAAELMPDLTDGETIDALEDLVTRVRSQGLPHFEEQPADSKGVVTWLIVQQWEDLFRRKGRLSRKDMVGCLNTVIASAKARMRRRSGRRYLKYLRRFMRRAGVSVKAIPFEALGDAGGSPEGQAFYNLNEMSLDALGDLFVSEPDVLGVDDAFENRVRGLILEGESDRVITLCRRLLERADEPYPRAILHTQLGMAYRGMDDLEQAVAMFQAAQSSEVTSIHALDELAETYREMERWEQAIATWRQCMEGLMRREQAPFYQEIAVTYRQMGNPNGEEAALRDLVDASKRKGCLFFIKRDSIAALGQLAEFLHRHKRESEWQALNKRIRRHLPRIQVDHFEDWAYWVRAWMAVDTYDRPLSYLESFAGEEPEPIGWITVLRAGLYDRMKQPRDAAPLWRRVQCEIAGSPYAWVLTRTVDILGDLLPASSRLFDIIEDEKTAPPPDEK